MGSKKTAWRAAVGLAALYAAILGARAAWSRYYLAVRLETSKPAYLHYDFVDVALRTRDRALAAAWRQAPPSVVVTRQGRPVRTIGGLIALPLRYDPAQDAFTGRWPCPWNAEAGPYSLALAPSQDGVDLSGRVRAGTFRIGRRRPAPLPPRFAVVTLESADPWRRMRVEAPDGAQKDWRGLLDWAKFVHADALWVMGGQTPGREPGQIWMRDNLDLLPEMARECHKRGLKFGVYVLFDLTRSKRRLPRYEYASDAKDGRPILTRAISLEDNRRVGDVIALLSRLRDIPDVDYLGLDYIRNALGGYELAPRFYAEMPGVYPPPEWGRLTSGERIVYFARKKIMRRDRSFIDSWQWWRSRQVALIVRRIKNALGDSKPLWAFTLTWALGHQHGQDPVMMNDAGVDADALMLYQADRPQFEEILREFHSYVHEGDAQLIVGDVIDWPLHQRSPDGPRELYRRVMEAARGIYVDGPARGIFFHDLKRALHGSLGPWGTRGWLRQARRAVDDFKKMPAAVAAKS